MPECYRQIIDKISQVVTLTKEEREQYTKRLSFRQFKKGSYLLPEGSICNTIWFINKGLCRYVVTREDEREMTTLFFDANDFITEFDSFYNDTPALYGILAQEDMEVVSISRDAIQWIYANIKNSNKALRIFLEHYYSILNHRIVYGLKKDPLALYYLLTTRIPNIEQRVSQRILASYLGITPVHLCRLKIKSNALRS